MKFNLTIGRPRLFWFATLIAVYGATPAQTHDRTAPTGAPEGGNTNLVMARSLYDIDKSGGGLTLPDGSAIKTVWPAALDVTTITDNPRWANQPVRPRCEPAVYSLARITPDGKEIWAKSYIFKGRVTEVCHAQYLGFAVRSALTEVEAPGFYRLPFNGRFFVGSPTDADKFEVDVATGDVFGTVPKNLRVVDAYALRALKKRLLASLVRLGPDRYEPAPDLYVELEKTLFPQPELPFIPAQ